MGVYCLTMSALHYLNREHAPLQIDASNSTLILNGTQTKKRLAHLEPLWSKSGTALGICKSLLVISNIVMGQSSIAKQCC